MITDFILKVVFAPFIVVLGLIPAVSLPSMLSSVVASSSGAMSNIGQVTFFLGEKLGLIGSWVNVPVLVSAMGAVGVAWVFHIAVRVLRLVLSVVSGGGGSS
jgi:hypothetical protein